MRVTAAEVGDAAEILALQKTAYRSEGDLYGHHEIPPLNESIEDVQLAFEQSLVLKAVLYGRIVGSVRAYTDRSTCHIGRLMVAPEHQRRGIGERLMTSIEAAHPDVYRFSLFTGSRSYGNIRLYRRLGYVDLHTEIISASTSLLHMEKLQRK